MSGVTSKSNTLEESPPAVIYALDFFIWKRRTVRLCFPHSKVIFITNAEQAPDRAWLAVWGIDAERDGRLPADRVIRVEDGFLRSVGLGADIILPMSFVLDRSGLYYDATRPSDLEVILSSETFNQDLLDRARDIRNRIVAAGLTKYNVGGDAWQPPATPRRLILVPGQVENDAALEFSAPGIRRNMGLLQAVRQANPEAYVIYKPHPDIVARLRPAGQEEHTALQWCDEVVVNVAMDQLLDKIHEVHVMTSTTGFEALLRDKQVTCYGQPFYAGWGLTTDIMPIPRRQRFLTLEELVAGALIRYPLYFDRWGRKLITPEAAMDQLLQWRNAHQGRLPWWRNLTRAAIRRVKGLR